MNIKKFLSKIHSDRAENSIMQTISIAVSAILIASGLVTAPGLINNARDTLARTDLANLAYAQEFAMSNVGQYYRYLTSGQELAETGENNGDNLSDAVVGNGGGFGNRLAGSDESDVDKTGFKFSFSGSVVGHEARVCQAPAFFIMKDYSSSGKWFYRGSVSGTTSSNMGDIVVPAAVLAACPNIIDGFEGGTPVDPGNPTVPVNGDDIPIPAGAAKLDVKVNSLIRDEYASVSGYNNNDTSHLGFGGGNSWTAENGTQLTISYFDPTSGTLVKFADRLADGNNEWVELVYDDFSGMLFGSIDAGYLADTDKANFNKIKTNGGSVMFTSAETGASVTAVWYPSIGDKYENSPKFPKEAKYRDKWFMVNTDGIPISLETNSDGTKIVMINSYRELSYSTDGGVTNTIIPGPNEVEGEYIDQIRDLETSNDGEVWWALTESSNIYKTSNHGVSWTKVFTPDVDAAMYPYLIDISEDGSKVAFATQFYNEEDKLVVLQNGAFTYNSINEAESGYNIYDIQWSPDGKLYINTISSESKMYYTSDDASTINYISALGSGQWYKMGMSSDGATVALPAGDSYSNGGIHISYDHGVTWTLNPGGLGSDYGVGLIVANAVVSPNGQDIIVGVSPAYRPQVGGIEISHDAGATWTKQYSPGYNGKGFWEVAASDNFDTLYAYSRDDHRGALWKHIAGETECYENCPGDDDDNGDNGPH